jgi:hypothetical protein
MKEIAWAVSAPACLLIGFCGMALLLGTEPMVVAKGVALGVPIVAYVIFSIFTVIWTLKVGEVGVHQNMSFQSKFYFWHGVSVLLTIVLSAAGSFILLFAYGVRGLTSGGFG